MRFIGHAPEYLSQELDRPLPTKDGGTLRTIGEAVEYMTAPCCSGRDLNARLLTYADHFGATSRSLHSLHVAVVASLFIVSFPVGGVLPAGAGVSTFPRMIGKPSLPLPMTTIFEFVDCAATSPQCRANAGRTPRCLG
jgi:hypothetical protein